MRWSTHCTATQVSSWILTSCQPHRITSGLIMHYIKIPSHQLRTQVTRSRADSCTMVLGAPQSTAHNQVKKGRQQAKTRRRTDQDDKRGGGRRLAERRYMPMPQLLAQRTHINFFKIKHGGVSTCRSQCQKY